MKKRSGFTLVELMVSVALAIIVLGLFAALYKWTTETYTQQRGNRRNDQRSRMMSIILRADIQNRSFREIVPFVPGQNTAIAESQSNYDGTQRQGYFAISENDPDLGTDDVLAFTIRIPADDKARPFQGRAITLAQPISDPANRNQPDFDDGNPNRNNTGASRAAEVVYFMRNGTLLRRVLLIREPYDGDDAQPSQIDGDYAPMDSSFWRDFDYAAWYKPRADAGCKFHGIGGSLANDNPPSSRTAQGYPPVLGIPPLRYGYSLNRAAALLPREYVGTTRRFIGRYLVQETSHSDFLYPGAITNGDPHARPDLTINSRGLVEQYDGDSTGEPAVRRTEDVIMTNVHEFDVKVWDSAIQQFVDLGHSNTAGDYARSKNLRSTTDDKWNRFDTWHPFKPDDGSNPLGNPPYKAGGLSAGLGSDNEKPLRAIQITIRFYDVPTKKMRQVTIVESMIK